MSCAMARLLGAPARVRRRPTERDGARAGCPAGRNVRGRALPRPPPSRHWHGALNRLQLAGADWPVVRPRQLSRPGISTPPGFVLGEGLAPPRDDPGDRPRGDTATR